MADDIQYPDEFLDKQGLAYLWGKIKSALNKKINKAPTTSPGNFASLDAEGNVIDSGRKHSDYIDRIQRKADKTDTVLNTSLTRGRRIKTLIGKASIGFGHNVEASGDYSQAFGAVTTASGEASHAEGELTIASGKGAHAEGGTLFDHDDENDEPIIYNTTAEGDYSHAEGAGTRSEGDYAHSEGYLSAAIGEASHAEGSNAKAVGDYSHCEGEGTVATGRASHVFGRYNFIDDYQRWIPWTANTDYRIGEKVCRNEQGELVGYICKTANKDAVFTPSHWNKDEYINYAEIVGNGKSNYTRSFARMLDWDGNEYLKGTLYVNGRTQAVATNNQIIDLENQINKLDAITWWSIPGILIVRRGNVCQITADIHPRLGTFEEYVLSTSMPDVYEPYATAKFALFGDLNCCMGLEVRPRDANNPPTIVVVSRAMATTTDKWWYGGGTYICKQ